MHIGSGVDYQHLASVCDAMVEQVLTSNVDKSHLGRWGLSTPYQQGDKRVDLNHYFSLWDSARQRITQHLGHDIELEIEPGRF